MTEQLFAKVGAVPVGVRGQRRPGWRVVTGLVVTLVVAYGGYAWLSGLPLHVQLAALAGPVEPFDEPGPAWLPHTTPQAAGLDPAQIAKLLDGARTSETGGLVLVRDGKLVVDRAFKGRNVKYQLASVTKAFTWMAVAILLGDGRIPSVDTPMSTWIRGWERGEKAKVTLRHVLTHTSARHGARTGRDGAANDGGARPARGAVAARPVPHGECRRRAVGLRARRVLRPIPARGAALEDGARANGGLHDVQFAGPPPRVSRLGRLVRRDCPSPLVA